MALGLLVEVAYEHDEEFRAHLPQVGGASAAAVVGPLRWHAPSVLRVPARHGVAPQPATRPPPRSTTTRPQLLHVCLLAADSAIPIVRRDAQQLLVYLLYSLSLKHLEGAQVSVWQLGAWGFDWGWGWVWG